MCELRGRRVEGAERSEVPKLAHSVFNRAARRDSSLARFLARFLGDRQARRAAGRMAVEGEGGPTADGVCVRERGGGLDC